MSGAPMWYMWEGDCWRPTPYYAKEAERAFGPGELRRLEVSEERSTASHNQFFAWVQDVFNNLPEAYRGRWTTPEDLRKWILTYTQFCDRREFKCSSRAEAVRWCRNLADDYHRIEIEGNTVVGYRAHSQSRHAMSKKAFQESKDAVAQVCAQILGVDVEDVRAA